MKLYDVIVIGGGPAGSHAARRLAEKGHRVMVLERKHQVGASVCCTGIVGQECADAFAIEDSVILRRVNRARLFSPSGSRLDLRRREPQACILDRAAFDISMAARAQAAGAEYVLGCPVKDIVVSGDGVVIAASRRGGAAGFEARCVVIASGFGSGLCRRLGLGVFGDFTAGAQVEVEAPGLEGVEVYFGRGVAPGFFAWLVPTAPPMARVGLMSRQKPGLYLREWLGQLAAQGRISPAGAEISYGGVPLRPLPRTFGERLLVVGDAAGQVKPTSGGGIYYGLLGAEFAAATLHPALEDGDLSAKRLARYQRGWRKRLGRELTTGYWARRFFERLSDEQVDRVFRVIKDQGIDEALLRADDLSFDWHSRTISRLIKYQMVSRAAELLKFPFRPD